MMTVLLSAIVIVAFLMCGEAFIRAVLVVRSRKSPSLDGPAVQRCLVLVPARLEGESVRRTLTSAIDPRAAVTLLLDGADPIAENIARELRCTVVVKEPPGPTKGAALGWFATTHGEEVRSGDAVLVLDVGSVLGRGFFDHLRWPEGVGALQALISGEGSGAGEAAAASERFAQSREDAGREAMGWTVRLRGTGTAFRPAIFLDVAPRLITQVEDLEASLLIMASGTRSRLSNARVIDEKPVTIQSAAAQRSRWLLGRYSLPWRHRRVLAQAMRRSSAEAVAFVFEILGRPLLLTIPFRVTGAIVAFFTEPFGAIVSATLGIVIMLSAALDVVIFLISGRTSASSLMKLAAAWIGAVVLLPRAMLRWMRVKRR